MFNKKKSNEFGNIEIKKPVFYSYDNNILITPTYVIIFNTCKENESMKAQMDYQDKVTNYINRKYENSIKKQYNDEIVDLYDNGKLIINNNEYSLKDYFIVYQDDKKYNLLNIKENNNYKYNHAVKFIDTTAFIELVNNKDVTIKDNKIYLNDDTILKKIVTNWNGWIHSEVKETDAIDNKLIVGDNNDE